MIWALVPECAPSQRGRDPKLPFRPRAHTVLPPLACPVLGSCSAAFLPTGWNKAQSCSHLKLRPSPCAAFTCPSPLCHRQPDSVTWDLPRSFSWARSREAAAASCVPASVGKQGHPEPWVQVGGVAFSPGQFSFLQPEREVQNKERRCSLMLILSLHYRCPRKVALVPWQLAVTLVQCSGLALWTLTKGRKAAAKAQGRKG